MLVEVKRVLCARAMKTTEIAHCWWFYSSEQSVAYSSHIIFVILPLALLFLYRLFFSFSINPHLGQFKCSSFLRSNINNDKHITFFFRRTQKTNFVTIRNIFLTVISHNAWAINHNLCMWICGTSFLFSLWLSLRMSSRASFIVVWYRDRLLHDLNDSDDLFYFLIWCYQTDLICATHTCIQSVAT